MVKLLKFFLVQLTVLLELRGKDVNQQVVLNRIFSVFGTPVAVGLPLFKNFLHFVEFQDPVLVGVILGEDPVDLFLEI